LWSARAHGLALVLVLALCPAASVSASTISGASLATCSPAPCQAASGVGTVSLGNVSNDNGTVSTRIYGLSRPRNLTGPAPAILVFYGGGNCGVVPASRFPQLAAANRFIVVYMAVPCGRDTNWDKRNIDAAATTVPDDEPYVNAVVKDLTRCPGQCVDPQRIYAAGMSSGGNMVADIMCDPSNSTLFRGYLIDSSSLQLFAGVPHCPSTNRSFFVMLALSDFGADTGLYYDTAPTPHLDVHNFATWAASRLGCAGLPQLGAIGTPLPTTLTYKAVGPCAYAAAGSVAVSALGVINGSHGWSCQDSDAHAPPRQCTVMPTPPGLSASGLPKTNGLFLEGEFWSFVAGGVSSSLPAPPPGEPVPPIVGPPPPGGPLPPETLPAAPTRELGWLALGDGYAAGEGGRPYLPGSDTASDSCHRSTRAYPFIAARRLGIPSALVSDHACGGASLASFYRPNARDHEPPQLSWLGSDAGVVTLMVGWNDVSMPAEIAHCGLARARCRRGRGRAFGDSIGTLAGSAAAPRSLRHLFKTVVSAAPSASVIALGYPRPFASDPAARCRLRSRRIGFNRASMRWIDREVQRLDATIQAAAAAEHITYVGGSYTAFGGHELCSRHPDLSDSFDPNRRGQLALAAELTLVLP
jgi:hypothetical protein